jgi:hypothetical protein
MTCVVPLTVISAVPANTDLRDRALRRDHLHARALERERRVAGDDLHGTRGGVVRVDGELAARELHDLAIVGELARVVRRAVELRARRALGDHRRAWRDDVLVVRHDVFDDRRRGRRHRLAHGIRRVDRRDLDRFVARPSERADTERDRDARCDGEPRTHERHHPAAAHRHVICVRHHLGADRLALCGGQARRGHLAGEVPHRRLLVEHLLAVEALVEVCE